MNFIRLVAVVAFGGLSLLGKAVLNPFDFGARGDGKADDTLAFVKLDQAIQSAEGPVEVVIPSGVFMVNPLKTPLREMAPGIMRRKCLLMLSKDYSTVRGGGIIKVIPGIDYTVGMKNGQEWYWAVVLIRANHCLVDGLNFSGNGTGTVSGIIAKQKNLRWEGVSALGPMESTDCLEKSRGYHTGNQVRNCRISGGGGQPIAMQFQKSAIIANNIVRNSTGMGFSRSDDCILMGNISIDSHDAPYIANGNCNNILIANNVSRHTSNGSGIDVVGCRNVVVQGNIIEYSAAWGLLIGYSVQQNAGCENILVSGNQFVRNCRSVDTPMNGEIMVGRPWGKSPKPIAGVTISGNQFVIDGTHHGRTKGCFVSIGYDVSDVRILNNSISGKLNPEQVILAAWQPVDRLVIKGNVFTGKGSPHCLVKQCESFQFDSNFNLRKEK